MSREPRGDRAARALAAPACDTEIQAHDLAHDLRVRLAVLLAEARCERTQLEAALARADTLLKTDDRQRLPADPKTLEE